MRFALRRPGIGISNERDPRFELNGGQPAAKIRR
jgi:hypothetical protein